MEVTFFSFLSLGVCSLQNIHSVYLRCLFSLLLDLGAFGGCCVQGAGSKNLKYDCQGSSPADSSVKMYYADPQLTQKSTLKVVPSNGCMRDCQIAFLVCSPPRDCFCHGHGINLCGFMNTFFVVVCFYISKKKMPFCIFSVYILYIKLK